ncbi:MAG: glucose-6-phosphate dehydrogenase, partial [Blastocatellia bacterium]
MESFDPATLTPEKLGQPGDPCTMIIFGAGGDLTKRKLIPALYNLAKGKLLPEQFAIVGVSREEYSTEQFRQMTTQEIRQFATGGFDTQSWEWFAKRLYYLSGDFKDPEAYKKLGETLGQVDREQSTQGNCLFYLATSPSFFAEIVKQLGAAGLVKLEKNPWRRVVIEKPFGHDLASAVSLNHDIG